MASRVVCPIRYPSRVSADALSLSLSLTCSYAANYAPSAYPSCLSIRRLRKTYIGKP